MTFYRGSGNFNLKGGSGGAVAAVKLERQAAVGGGTPFVQTERQVASSASGGGVGASSVYTRFCTGVT